MRGCFRCHYGFIVLFSVVPLWAVHLADGRVAFVNFDLVHTDRLPTWSNGRLLAFTGNRTAAPVITAIDDSGAVRDARVIQIPGADRVALLGVGRQPDGSVVASGFSWTPEGREATFLAIV